jgi:hypothetical protein
MGKGRNTNAWVVIFSPIGWRTPRASSALVHVAKFG